MNLTNQQGAFHVNAETVKLVLDNRANINAKNPRQKTPLHCAIDSWEPEGAEIVRVLSAAGADIGLRDRSGRTPLSKAEKAHNPEVRRPLAAKADL